MKKSINYTGRPAARQATLFFSFPHLALALLMGLLGSGAPAAAAERTWTGAVSSDWLNATNWSPHGVPASGDTANIASGLISFSAPVTFSGQINWTGGTLYSGRLTLAANAVMNVSGTAEKRVGDLTLHNWGRIVWSDAGRMVWNWPGKIVNQAGATWEITGDGAFNSEFGEGGSITNLGTVVKSGGTGTNSLYGFFYNHGLVHAQTGALAFYTGGGGNGGEFRAAAGAQNRFMSGTYTWDGVGFTGGGANRVAGWLTFDGTMTSENLELAAGSLSGTSTLAGTAMWTGGHLNSGRLTLAAGAVLNVNGAEDKRMGLATLENGGRIVWADTGRLVWNFPGLIVNLAGATWEITGDGLFSSEYGEGGSVTNLGTIVKSGGTGTNSLYGFFYNHGLVHAQTGALAFYTGGGGNGGEFRAAAGAQNRFMSGTYTWDGISFTGSGANRVAGWLTFNGTMTSENLELATGGSMSGTSTLVGTARWTGGQLNSGQLTLAAGAVLNVDGAGDKRIGGATLENGGQIVWADTGRLVWSFPGLIVNQARATWEITGDGLFSSEYGEGGSITNLGTIVKSGGTGINSLYGFFYNHGLVHAQTGGLAFHTGGGGTGGEFRAAAGAQNRFMSGTYAWDEISFTGSGANRVAGSTTFNGTMTSENLELVTGGSLSGTSTLSGTARWTGGQLNSGQLTLAADAVWNLSGGDDKRIGLATLENWGRIVWADAGRLVWFWPGLIVNQVGATWEITGDSLFSSEYAEGGSITNLGTIVKSGGTGATSLYGFLYNHGLVHAQTGALAFYTGGGGNGGEFRAAAGAQNRFMSGTYAWDGISFTGSGANRVEGWLTFNGTMTSENLELATGGSLSGTSTLAGTARWTGGQLNSGRLTLAAEAVWNLSGTEDKRIGLATLENLGRIVWADAGRLVWTWPGTIVNQEGATWEIAGGGPFDSEYGEGGSITNLGAIVKSGPGTNSLYGFFYNHGLVDVQTGAIRLATAATLSPGSILSFAMGGATPGAQHGLLLVNGAINLEGTVQARLTNGFVPEVSQTFQVIQANTLTGTFANTNIALASSFWALTPEYSANHVLLRATYRTPTPSTLLGGWDTEGFRIRLAGGEGENYRVEASTNLTDWTTLFTTNLPASVLEFDDPSARDYPRRFYRTVAVP